MWNTFEKNAKTAVLQWLDRRSRRKLLTPDAVDWTRIRRIMVVRQHDQLGDFLLTTPAIYALRQRFPDVHITLIVRDYLEPVAFGNPDVDQIAILPESAYRWTPVRLARFLTSVFRHHDLTVVFNTVSHSLTSDLIARCSRARIILGPAVPTFDHCDDQPFYTMVSRVAPTVQHQIQRNLDTVRFIGADTQSLRYRFALSDEEEEKGRATLHALLPDRPARVIGVHFGTGDLRKRYPIAQLGAVCRQLADQGDTTLIVLPAPGEKEAMRELTAAETVCIHAPAMPLREVAAFIKTLDLLICNDTGVLHLAAAVDTPTVSFHATSDPAIWKPPGAYFIALYAPSGDIRSIPVEQVVETANRAITRKRQDVDGEPEIYTVG